MELGMIGLGRMGCCRCMRQAPSQGWVRIGPV
jgi:6-phosphogluconate dehydrogenase (decarboxylating)